MRTRVNPFVTTRQAADMLDVSLGTIQLWSESGILKAWKTAGGHRRVSAESVNRIRDEQVQAIGADGNSSTIVIVEDDPVFRELYKPEIASWQFSTGIATAKNGFEGLLAIGKLSPQLVITDLCMPGIDGFQMIRALRDGRSDLDIVVITSLSDCEIRRSGGLPQSVTILKKSDSLDRLEALLRQKFGVLADMKSPSLGDVRDAAASQ